jgi:hypothetical protein
MKQPKKLTPPVKDIRKSLYIEIDEKCTHDYHSGEQYGEWSKEYSNTVTKISRNEKLLDKWNFSEYKVSDEVYNSPFLYLVVVTYSSGDSFGRSSGNTSIAYITGNPDEALKIKGDLDRGINPPKDDPNSQNGGYYPWDGYFERVEDVNIVFLPVMG